MCHYRSLDTTLHPDIILDIIGLIRIVMGNEKLKQEVGSGWTIDKSCQMLDGGIIARIF